jgi:nucleobase:cation symporter-1, NCS1 family
MASASIALGLSWRQVLPAIAVGNLILSLAITANGTIGARLHVPFPVLNRSSFGFYFSYLTVVSRQVRSSATSMLPLNRIATHFRVILAIFW